MASTFPLQVVDAGTVGEGPRQRRAVGDQLVAALQPMPWDPSVKSLVPFPQIVSMLGDQLEWT